MSDTVLVKKEDGIRDTKVCFDYRKINNMTERDAYQLSTIDDYLGQLRDIMWFSTVDLCYWQGGVKPTDKHKTAFTMRCGLYDFSIMPCGLCIPPAAFKQLIQTVLSGLQLKGENKEQLAISQN